MSDTDALIEPDSDAELTTMSCLSGLESDSQTSQDAKSLTLAGGAPDGVDITMSPISASTPLARRGSHIDSTVVEPDVTPLVPGINGASSSRFTTATDVGEESCVASYDGDAVEDDVIVKHVLGGGPSRETLMVPGVLKVPIVGYETMESRSKFTIYKIHVMMGEEDMGWFVFRRYSDFYQLNDQLRFLFPNVRLVLPPKRWFRSNFDPSFLEERKKGLQEFLENVTGHRDICSSQPVQDFFCFDDPPSMHDSLEESRAQCECMEETIYLLKKELGEKEIEMDLLKEEINLYKNQVRLLTDRLSQFNKAFYLQAKNGLERKSSTSSQKTSSLAWRLSGSGLEQPALETNTLPALEGSNSFPELKDTAETTGESSSITVTPETVNLSDTSLLKNGKPELENLGAVTLNDELDSSPARLNKARYDSVASSTTSEDIFTSEHELLGNAEPALVMDHVSEELSFVTNIQSSSSTADSNSCTDAKTVNYDDVS